MHLGNHQRSSTVLALMAGHGNIQVALSLLIGAALGSSVYIVAEARHSKQVAECSASHAAPPPAAAPEAVAKAAPAPAPEPNERAPEQEPAKSAPEAPAEPEDPKARALAARSAAELALLDEARTQLEAKNTTGAQATLDRMKKRFARGTLAQERELLRIEVYKARGQLPAAKRAAKKFAKTFPESPHLDELTKI
jgi:hypothetical protein